ncbi:phage N-6-adenine-methyltransferase [Mesorhizobium sp. CA8]|uniref:phage N-6-adenine-methyltransferase n=1 Tax=Mesorhizobium sp. CA8 TaxID=2876637 RepID=UPI001CCED366|nr:phage N-6-adenine-methyltransferase [Mesorhizobium sp. CA8]MBZ9759464.1 phage N-6-adenine-methyltransferase [Mesorhizobium sp. CA8]
MSHWETAGQSDEWYTPKYIFDALGCRFDLDVAHPHSVKTHVPADMMYSADGLDRPWHGLVWMNPPFGGRNSIEPWLDKFFDHGHGIALAPDRTSCPWWQTANRRASFTLFIAGKVKFERPDGSLGKSPSNGTTLFAVGPIACQALKRAEERGLGCLMFRYQALWVRAAA